MSIEKLIEKTLMEEYNQENAISFMHSTVKKLDTKNQIKLSDDGIKFQRAGLVTDVGVIHFIVNGTSITYIWKPDDEALLNCIKSFIEYTNGTVSLKELSNYYKTAKFTDVIKVKEATIYPVYLEGDKSLYSVFDKYMKSIGIVKGIENKEEKNREEKYICTGHFSANVDQVKQLYKFAKKTLKPGEVFEASEY